MSAFWKSLRGRFRVIAIVFFVSLLAIAWLAEWHVENAITSSLQNTAERQHLHEETSRLHDTVTSFNQELLYFLIIPSPELQASILPQIDSAITQVAELEHQVDEISNMGISPYLKPLKQELTETRKQVEHLTILRQDINLLYPSNSLLLGQMLPANNAFLSSSSLAMQSSEENASRIQNKVYRLLSETRHAWTNKIGAFRMYIANRSGIFGSPVAGMQAQKSNIKLYSDKIDELLGELLKYYTQEKLMLVQELALDEMLEANKLWEAMYQQATSIYESKHWRTDTPLYKNTIQPLLVRINNNLTGMEKNIESVADSDINALGNLADNMRKFVWVLGLLAILLMAFGYYIFILTIQRPVTQVVNAIKAEASGNGEDINLPETHIEETRNLVESFEEMRSQVHSRQQRLESILDNAGEAIVTIDENGIIEGFNKAAQKLFQYKVSEVIGKNVNMLMTEPHKSDHDMHLQRYAATGESRIINRTREFEAQRKDGSVVPISLKVSEMWLEGRRHFTGIMTDISEQKATMDHLKYIAQHDSLTGLYNRSHIQGVLNHVVEQCRRSGKQTNALLYIDLDNFKFINDTMGHDAGDKLLIEVADHLLKRSRKGDVLARFGGDEFTVLLFDVTTETAIEIAESFRSQIVEYSFKHLGRELDIGCSIGIATITPETASQEEVLSQADYACNQAKHKGRNRVRLFRPKDRASVIHLTNDMGWSRRIKNALEKNRFILARQPIIDINNRKIVYYEILVRLVDENNKIIMPSAFLPAAERFGLSGDIDKWVIEHAITLLVRQRNTEPALCYAINLGSRTLSEPDICDFIQQKLADSGLEPAALSFEVTETTAIADMEAAVTTLSRLQAMGCKTALDDFGAGMSSFAYLKELPVDTVKIDGRFVKDLPINHFDQAMVKSMSQIAHVLGKNTVAEYIDDEETIGHLRVFGVEYGQGFHIGKPELIESEDFGWAVDIIKSSSH